MYTPLHFKILHLIIFTSPRYDEIRLASIRAVQESTMRLEHCSPNGKQTTLVLREKRVSLYYTTQSPTEQNKMSLTTFPSNLTTNETIITDYYSHELF